MSVQIVQFSTDASRVREVEEEVRALFQAVQSAAPTGIKYVASRLGDGGDFLIALQLQDGSTNPLLDIPEALAFRAKVAAWAGGPVPPQAVTELARYHG